MGEEEERKEERRKHLMNWFQFTVEGYFTLPLPIIEGAFTPAVLNLWSTDPPQGDMQCKTELKICVLSSKL